MKRSPLQACVRPAELRQLRETVQTTNAFRNGISPINQGFKHQTQQGSLLYIVPNGYMDMIYCPIQVWDNEPI